MREIKFRGWNGKTMYQWADLLAHDDFNFIMANHGADLSPWTLMQFTGLLDKNGVEIYEGDILRMTFPAGEEKDGWTTDAAYSVQPLSHEGFSLWARSMMSDDQNNQHPIHNTPSFRYGSLTTDSRNEHYDHLAVAETWGKNDTFRTHWRQSGYSNDVTVIGNIYEHKHLLDNPETKT